jgi:hypothetical protein
MENKDIKLQTGSRLMNSTNQVAKTWNISMIKDLLNTTDQIRGSGRTTAYAQAYIELAWENKDIEFIVRDHFPTKMADDCLLDKLKIIVEEENKRLESQFYRTRFIVRDNRLVCTHQPEKYGRSK